MTPQPRRLPFDVAILVLALLIFAGLVIRLWPFTTDDAFITFRYSQNLAAGFGPNFNRDGPHIEGYTTFLWMLLMAIPALVGVDLVAASKVMGLAAMLGTMAAAYRFAHHLLDFLDDPARKLAAALAVLLMVAFPGTPVHTISGMETALFALLVTLFVWRVTRLCAAPSRRSPVAVALIGLAMGLTRPEGNLVAGISLAAVFVLSDRAARRALRPAMLLGYILPGGVYFTWRVLYYGHLLPLPFYMKVISAGVLAGRYDVASFLMFAIIHVGILMLLALQRISRVLLPAVMGSLALIVFFLFPAHIMGFDGRYLFPIIPAIAVLAALGLGELASRMGDLNDLRRGLYLIVAVGIAAAGMLVEIAGTLRGAMAYAEGLQRAHIPLGKRLAAFDPGGDTPILAVGDAGAIPYYSGWQTVDRGGLNDPHIALTGDYSAAYILSHQPDVIELHSAYAQEFVGLTDSDWTLYEASLEAGMVPVKKLRFGDNYYLWVMVMPGSAIAEHLEGWKPGAGP